MCGAPGTKLVNEAIQKCKEAIDDSKKGVASGEPIEEAYLHVQTNNEDAIKFYEVKGRLRPLRSYPAIPRSLAPRRRDSCVVGATEYRLDRLASSQRLGFVKGEKIEGYYKRVGIEPPDSFVLRRSFKS